MNGKMKSLLVAAGLLFTGMVNGQTVQQGLSQLDGDQPTKAKATMTAVVAASPTAENMYYLGYAQLRTGDLAGAKATFEKGLVTEPKQPLNSVGLATLMLANKNGEGAKGAFDKILLETKMKNGDVLFRIAEAYTLYEHTNNPGEAVRLIDLIPEKTKKPLTDAMQIVKGDAFLLKNDGGPAASAYEQALLVNKSAKAHIRLGVVYLRGKNYKATLESYQNAFDVDSTFAPYYKRLGEYLVILNKFKQASKYFKLYVERSESSPSVLFDAAKLLFLSKNYKESMDFLEKAETGGVKDEDMFRMKGYSNIELGNPQSGLDNLELMVKSGVKPYYLDNAYFAKAYQSLKKDSLALIYYEKAAPLDTLNNHYSAMYDITYKQKKFNQSFDYAMKSMDWKTAKKQALTATDWYNVGMAQYYLTAYTPKEDTLGRYNKGMKADSLFMKAIALNDKWAPFYMNRARTNNYIDYTGTKWLAAPHYEKWLTVVDIAKADKDVLYNTYRYLAGYNSVVTKDLVKVQENVDKAVAIKTDDPDKLKELLNPAPAVAVPPTTGTVKTPTPAVKPPKK
jgi:tetratricopeptide (TPR) repeat protein